MSLFLSERSSKYSAQPSLPDKLRPALARMKHIFDRLRDGELTNCQKLARELEVSRKTIQRDIDCMRDQLGLPIEYDAATHGYRFTEAVHDFPTIQVTQGELLALLVAHKAIEQYHGTPYHAQLQTAFAKLLAPLREAADLAPLDEVISFKISAPAVGDLEAFTALSSAIISRQSIRFDYRKPGTASAAPREVRPYHLTHREGRWYLIAHDVHRGAMRTFALSRIRDIEIQRSRFERPKDFSVDNYFAAALGVMNGTETHRVRIRFSRLAADHIRDRYWHESQEILPLPDGGIELKLVLADLLEVERLILQWGGHAEALEPKELRTRIYEAGEKLARLHKG